jgi:hypothetical protein
MRMTGGGTGISDGVTRAEAKSEPTSAPNGQTTVDEMILILFSSCAQTGG